MLIINSFGVTGGVEVHSSENAEGDALCVFMDLQDLSPLYLLTFLLFIVDYARTFK